MEAVSFRSSAFAEAWLARRARTARLLDELLYPRVKELLGDISGDVTADLGCGNGASTKILREAAKIFACDTNDLLLERASINVSSLGVQFLAMDLDADFPFPADFFDAIICCQVLMHLDNPSIPVLIREVARTLRRNGQAVLTTGHPEWVQRRTKEQGDIGKLEDQRVVRYGDWEGTTIRYYFCYNEFYEKMFRSAGLRVKTHQIDFPIEMCSLVPEYHDRAGWPLFTLFHIYHWDASQVLLPPFSDGYGMAT